MSIFKIKPMEYANPNATTQQISEWSLAHVYKMSFIRVGELLLQSLLAETDKPFDHYPVKHLAQLNLPSKPPTPQS